jgi:hypothetical protein
MQLSDPWLRHWWLRFTTNGVPIDAIHYISKPLTKVMVNFLCHKLPSSNWEVFSYSEEERLLFYVSAQLKQRLIKQTEISVWCFWLPNLENHYLNGLLVRSRVLPKTHCDLLKRSSPLSCLSYFSFSSFQPHSSASLLVFIELASIMTDYTHYQWSCDKGITSSSSWLCQQGFSL